MGEVGQEREREGESEAGEQHEGCEAGESKGGVTAATHSFASDRQAGVLVHQDHARTHTHTNMPARTSKHAHMPAISLFYLSPYS